MLGNIIASYPGVGKAYLANKYKNVIDLDSAQFAYIIDNKLLNIKPEKRKGLYTKNNPNWPQNYINTIKEAVKSYDYVLVWTRMDAIEEYIKNGLKFSICYPDKKFFLSYEERYKNRENNNIYINKKKEEYHKYIQIFENMDVNKIILKENETLEDFLVKNNAKLILR